MIRQLQHAEEGRASAHERLQPCAPSGIQLPRGLKSAFLIPLGLILLIPSATFLWRFGVLPQLGNLQDAGVYYVSAKSLAEGGGYRIESLPGEPAQTEKPPLYPLLLSLAWRIDPQFPRNVAIAALISWLALPAMLLLSAAYFPKLGVSGWRARLLVCLIAVSPYVVFYSSQLLTDILFLALLLLTMLLVEGGVSGPAATALPIAAGAAAGLLYLTRSAGIAMLPAAMIYFALRGKWGRALWFAAAASPFVAGWIVWARVHQAHSADIVLMQYTDYLGSEIYTLRHVSVPRLLWKNLDGLIWALGSLVQPRMLSEPMRIVASMLGVAMIAGVVRMVRRGQGVLYALFAAGTVLILIVYFFPPDERLVLPLLPLGLAGLLVEIEHLAAIVRAGLRHRYFSHRILAAVLATATGLVLAASMALQIYLTFIHLPDAARHEELTNFNRLAAYHWIAANVPVDAALLTGGNDDPLLFLYTGRHATLNVMPLTFWYQDEHSRMVDWIANPAPFARAHGLTYFEFAGVNTSWEGLSEADGAAAARAILQNPDLKALYRSGGFTVYSFVQ